VFKDLDESVNIWTESAARTLTRRRVLRAAVNMNARSIACAGCAAAVALCLLSPRHAPSGPGATIGGPRAFAAPRGGTGSGPIPGAVPRNCPAGPPPRVVSRDFTPAIGAGPVWAAGFAPGITLHVSTGNAQNAKYLTRTPHGWEVKVLWVMRPGYRHKATLRGGNRRTGAPLWFQIRGGAPSTAPVLDPRPSKAIIGGVDRWAQFPSYLLIPQAACYSLEARWPGGSWRLTFAAGY